MILYQDRLHCHLNDCSGAADMPDKTVFTDDEIVSQMLAILRNAEKEAILVSPYITLWGHAAEVSEASRERWER